MARAKIIAVAAAIVVIVILALQNMTTVDASILFFTANVPLAALLVLSFIIGVIAGLFVALTLGGKRKGAARRT